MKIRINEKESYEFNTKDELNAQEFLMFKDRINVIAKLMHDPFVVKQSSTISSQVDISSPVEFSSRLGIPRKPGIFSIINSRQDAIDILKLFYSDIEALNEKYIKIGRNGLVEKSGSTKLIYKEMTDIRRKFIVNPSEVGFTKFPLPSEVRARDYSQILIDKIEDTEKSKELKKSVGEVQMAITPRPPIEEPVEEPKEI